MVRPMSAVLIATVMVAATFAAGRSQPTVATRADQAGKGTILAGPWAASVPPWDAMSYGLAEPARSLPGTQSAADVAAWSQIRADLVGSGACWLRSDLDTWLANAIAAFDWLGSSRPCPATADGPIKVLAILDQQSVWAARRLCPDAAFSNPSSVRRRDFSLDDWRQLVRCIADRFIGRISAYEIWNEPLLAKSMLGYQDGSATHYADLLRVAYTEIKSSDPQAIVLALGGSDLYAGGDQTRLDQMRALTGDLLSLGAARYADAISLHGYPWGHNDSALWTSYREELRFQQNAWAKPVWITETGARAIDPGTQTAYLATAYSLFMESGVRETFWFSITDQPDGNFGLRGRPVESALHAFALGQATVVPHLGPHAVG
jgi:hypothetical protein